MYTSPRCNHYLLCLSKYGEHYDHYQVLIVMGHCIVFTEISNWRKSFWNSLRNKESCDIRATTVTTTTTSSTTILLLKHWICIKGMQDEASSLLEDSSERSLMTSTTCYTRRSQTLHLRYNKQIQSHDYYTTIGNSIDWRHECSGK